MACCVMMHFECYVGGLEAEFVCVYGYIGKLGLGVLGLDMLGLGVLSLGV